MAKSSGSKLVTGGSLVTAIGAIALAASQMYAANQQTERTRIESEAKRVCQGQQIEDSDSFMELFEELKTCLKGD